MARKPHPAGQAGERLAARLLKKKGYKILQRNYSCPSGEIDIVALHGQAVVFVEVKSRSTDFGPPENSVTPAKQTRMGRVAREYFRRHSLEQLDARFDVIGVLHPPGEKPTVQHFVNAFSLPNKRR